MRKKNWVIDLEFQHQWSMILKARGKSSCF
nr:MAG TPA: hypothetical protein [Caudoviricetes sp.]